MFCGYQIYAEGDSRRAYACDQHESKAELFCGAHLHEARAFPCPYNPEQIFEQEGRKRIAFRDSKGNIGGVCEDFEPIKQSAQTQP